MYSGARQADGGTTHRKRGPFVAWTVPPLIFDDTAANNQPEPQPGLLARRTADKPLDDLGRDSPASRSGRSRTASSGTIGGSSCRATPMGSHVSESTSVDEHLSVRTVAHQRTPSGGRSVINVQRAVSPTGNKAVCFNDVV